MEIFHDEAAAHSGYNEANWKWVLRSVVRLSVRTFPWIVASLLFFSSSVVAQVSGVFIGFHGAVTQSDATYNKTVANTLTNTASSVEGMSFSTGNSGDGNLANLGAIAGFRHVWDNQFASVQLEASLGAGRVSGFVLGDGVSRERAQYGEAWPETFEVGTSTEFGIVGKWGRELQTTNWAAVTAFYGLAGVKQSSLELESRYELGCFMLETCVGPQFESGEFEYTAKGQKFVIGGGLEHAFSDRFVAQLELRFESAIEDEWRDSYEEGALTVNPTLEVQDISFALNLSRFF